MNTDNTEAQHTPGPWDTSRHDLNSFTINPETGALDHVVYVYPGDQGRIPVFGGSLNNARPTANLIAAAPDLLTAAKAMFKEWDNIYDGCEEDASKFSWAVPYIARLEAAIAKAEGKAV